MDYCGTHESVVDFPVCQRAIIFNNYILDERQRFSFLNRTQKARIQTWFEILTGANVMLSNIFP